MATGARYRVAGRARLKGPQGQRGIFAGDFKSKRFSKYNTPQMTRRSKRRGYTAASPTALRKLKAGARQRQTGVMRYGPIYGLASKSYRSGVGKTRSSGYKQSSITGSYKPRSSGRSRRTRRNYRGQFAGSY